MIAEFLARTPAWAWGILLALLGLGWWQSRPRLVRRGTLFILPGLMLGLSPLGLVGAFGARGFWPPWVWTSCSRLRAEPPTRRLSRPLRFLAAGPPWA